MGERGVGGSLGGYVNGGRKKEICLLTFLGTLGVSRMVRCCISIVSITIFIFMTIISILTTIYSLHKDIHLTAPDMPSQIPTLFSPCPLSLFHLHLYAYPHAEQGGQSALSFKTTFPVHGPRTVSSAF
jgi:hypothetical protein